MSSAQKLHHAPLGSTTPAPPSRPNRFRCRSSHPASAHTPPPGTSNWHILLAGSNALHVANLRGFRFGSGKTVLYVDEDVDEKEGNEEIDDDADKMEEDEENEDSDEWDELQVVVGEE